MPSKKTTIFVQQEETFIRRRQTVIKVEASYVQLYKNIRQYTLALSPGTAIDVLLFLITKMSDNNGVRVNKEIMAEYSSSLPKPMSERNFHRLVKMLVNNKMLIMLQRGEYKLNPVIVWQGDIGTRMEHIKFLEQGGVNLKPNEKLLLDKTQDSEGNETVLGNENWEEILDFEDVEIPGDEIPKEVEPKKTNDENRKDEWASFKYPKPKD